MLLAAGHPRRALRSAEAILKPTVLPALRRKFATFAYDAGMEFMENLSQWI